MENTNNDETNDSYKSKDTNTTKDIEITQKETSKSSKIISNNEIPENPKIEALAPSIESSEDNTQSSSVYEIEKIVSHKYNKKLRQMEYLIKWNGYPDNENTWENEQNLTKEVIEEYTKGLEKNNSEKDNTKNSTTKAKNETKIYKEDEIMNMLVKSIKKIERTAKNEKIVVTNELSQKIQSVIRIVYREKPVYENIFVIVKLDDEIREFSIKEAEIKFPVQIIRYFNEKSVYN